MFLVKRGEKFWHTNAFPSFLLIYFLFIYFLQAHILKAIFPIFTTLWWYFSQHCDADCKFVASVPHPSVAWKDSNMVLTEPISHFTFTFSCLAFFVAKPQNYYFNAMFVYITDIVNRDSLSVLTLFHSYHCICTWLTGLAC